MSFIWTFGIIHIVGAEYGAIQGLGNDIAAIVSFTTAAALSITAYLITPTIALYWCGAYLKEKRMPEGAIAFSASESHLV